MSAIHMPLEQQEQVAKLLGYQDLQVERGTLQGRLNGIVTNPPEVFDYNLLALAEKYLHWQQRLHFLGLLLKGRGSASLWSIRSPDLTLALDSLLASAALPVGD